MKEKTVTHRQVLRFLWPYVRRHLPLLLCMLLSSFVITALSLAQPFFYKEAIDAIAGNTVRDTATFSFALRMIVLGVGCAAVMTTLEQLAGLLLGRIESRIKHALESDVFSHVQRLSTDFHVNAFAGATARKMRRGIDAVEGIMDRVWFNFLPAIVTAVGLGIVLFFYAPIIGAVILASMIIYTALSIGLNLILARYYTWSDEQDTKTSANAVDTLTGNAAVKSFSAESREDERHEAFTEELRRRTLKTWSISTFMTLGQFLFLIAVEGIVLVLSLWLWKRGEFTPGGFIVATFYVGQLWNRLTEIGRNLRDYLRNMAHCEEMVLLAERPLSVQDAPGAPEISVTKGAIDLQDVRFRYGSSDRWIFDGLSLSIQPGERIALVGHSGGGKSSLIKLLFRLYDVQEGSIRIDDQDIAKVTQESVRQSLSLVPQDPMLFHRTIAENIAYGKPDATRQQIEHAAQLAHAHEFITRLPAGYETLVGERGVKLSGGERQRVAIARALLADRPILVLDEATSSLDSLSESYIQEGLEILMRGRTSLVIAHRLSTIKKADRILVIEDGHIVEQGTHAELVTKDGGAYRTLYELQAGGFIGE